MMRTPEHLIQKYNTQGPRYTSYPPLPFWRATPVEAEWFKHVIKGYDHDLGVDLYVHVPYCESLCYYCGCNRIITKNHDVESEYVEMILKEWAIYKQNLGFVPVVGSLHFGGGTPTFLSPEHLDRLIMNLTSERSEPFIGSIEVDPRTCKKEHIQVLVKNRMKRVSLGIQDFDPAVQQAIHRDQSPEMVRDLVKLMRQEGIESINFDLIYGLPKQTVDTIKSTIALVNDMRPDLIAFYSYAHLPERIKNQRLIKNQDLPGPTLKRELYESGRELLTKEGYRDVGMDHFARPASYLYQAMESKNLHRNFMGYVDKKSQVLIGLGPSSISDSSYSFIQNSKELKDYQASICSGRLAIEKGHSHNQLDLIVQNIIQDLMCQHEVSLAHVKDLPLWDQIEKELRSFEEDGLLVFQDSLVQIQEIGKGFTRNIAMVFDFYLRDQQNNKMFSQTI